MDNPFEILDQINERLERIENSLNVNPITSGHAQAIEKPITTEELCEFLGLSRPTIIRMKKKGKIPFLQIGASIRFDKITVLKALEKASNKLKSTVTLSYIKCKQQPSRK